MLNSLDQVVMFVGENVCFEQRLELSASAGGVDVLVILERLARPRHARRI